MSWLVAVERGQLLGAARRSPRAAARCSMAEASGRASSASDLDVGVVEARRAPRRRDVTAPNTLAAATQRDQRRADAEAARREHAPRRLGHARSRRRRRRARGAPLGHTHSASVSAQRACAESREAAPAAAREHVDDLEARAARRSSRATASASKATSRASASVKAGRRASSRRCCAMQPRDLVEDAACAACAACSRHTCSMAARTRAGSSTAAWRGLEARAAAPTQQDELAHRPPGVAEGARGSTTGGCARPPARRPLAAAGGRRRPAPARPRAPGSSVERGAAARPRGHHDRRAARRRGTRARPRWRRCSAHQAAQRAARGPPPARRPRPSG